MSADHARAMDAMYRSQRHIYDLTRKFYLLGRDRLIAELAPPPGGSVVEIGCGTARNLIQAARAWPHAHFYGLDISEEMLATARAKVAAAGLSHRITLAQGDATDFDSMTAFGIATTDRVFMSYTLSMIPGWERAIAQAASILAPDGRLSIVDFGQQERMPRGFRRLLFAWLARFDVHPRAALTAVVGHIASERALSAGIRPLYRGYAWQAALTRGADR